MVRRAVIDVGTNSVKLLVADVASAAIQPVLEKSEQTRLGRGLYDTHHLQAEAIGQTARAVAAFARQASEAKAVVTRVIATSAAREALNRDELARAIRQSADLPVEIISGEQEAEWVFRGVSTDLRLAEQRLLILDVGGGSTEIILGARGHHTFRHSFAMGSVRLLEKLRPADPPSLLDLAQCRSWLRDFFQQHVGPSLQERLSDAVHGQARLVGTGGTATILARMESRLSDFDRDRIEATCLSRSRLLGWMVDLWGVSLAQRKRIVGLPPNRADVILTGVAIYEAIMEHFDFPELLVSTRGLRFGAILDGA
jgi:exopolyphosphatase/guanosine-5'-triphosphate,3'-diphosphate pyrophosphatase